MTAKELTKLKRLEREMVMLRSLAISIAGQDDEGRYQPEFVAKIKRAATETPRRTFHSAEVFLAEIDSL
jgi:hypothetical protein